MTSALLSHYMKIYNKIKSINKQNEAAPLVTKMFVSVCLCALLSICIKNN